MDPPGDIMVPTTPLRKSLIPVFIDLLFTEMPMTWSHGVTLVNVKAKSYKKMKCPKMQFKYVEAKALPTNDARVVVKFLKSLFARFGTPRAIISDRVEVSNRGLKRILERTIGENHASWPDKLEDALWAFRIAFKTPIGCTPYKLDYSDYEDSRARGFVLRSLELQSLA
ncbi:reverse transcriptase domain-containing protein [Tanacetum coccineum]|uniref:Reverse transcriptase domain-containing protein n=1 Tax=Tanacetum coccineum TaxID=301880 RepID=A0ABQ5APM0_9ASTR